MTQGRVGELLRLLAEASGEQRDRPPRNERTTSRIVGSCQLQRTPSEVSRRGRIRSAQLLSGRGQSRDRDLVTWFGAARELDRDLDRHRAAREQHIGAAPIEFASHCGRHTRPDRIADQPPLGFEQTDPGGEEMPFQPQERSHRHPDVVPLGAAGADLASLDGCFRYFHWTRLLGNAEPGRESTGDTPQMRLGSIAHKMLETAILPAAGALRAAGLSDLGVVFDSTDWRDLLSASPEREMPFIMHIQVEGRDCWVRGRMDAVVPGEVPRVIDYKYAAWREGGEANYEIQMTAYALALMKALGTGRAIGELWYLKSPMKILRHEYTIAEAEQRLRDLMSRYFMAVEKDEWPAAERAYCDRVECGFRTRCWGED